MNKSKEWTFTAEECDWSFTENDKIMNDISKIALSEADGDGVYAEDLKHEAYLFLAVRPYLLENETKAIRRCWRRMRDRAAAEGRLQRSQKPYKDKEHGND